MGKTYLEPEALNMVVSSMDQSGRLQGILHACFAAAQSLSLTENRPGSKSLPGGTQQARGDLVKALKTLLMSFV